MPTPIEMEESAILNTGLKNTKLSPPKKGNQVGKRLSMIGK